MAGFYNPLALLLLGLLPILYYFHIQVLKKRKASAIKFSVVSSVLSSIAGKRYKKNKYLLWLHVIIIALLILALANPHIPIKHTKKGVNVVLVIDVSGSMNAQDYKPSRLEAAKQAAITLVKSLQSNDYVGVVIFESGASAAAYLTPNKKMVIEKIKSISPREGRTAIGDGLATAVDMAISIPNKKRVVILLSDGVNNAGVISPEEAVEYARLNKVQVFTVGMGTRGRTVLGYDWFGNPIYSELDENTLKYIAKATGGKYFKSVDSKTLKEIYKNLNKEIKREPEETSIRPYLLVIIFVLCLIEFYFRYIHGVIIQ